MTSPSVDLTAPRLRDVPGFRLFAGARAVSWVGTALTLVALPVLVMQLSGSAALVGLVATIESLPYLLLGLPAGALVDRWDQRRVVVVTSVVPAVALLSLPAARAAQVLTVPHVLAVALAVSVSFVFFDAAGFGVLPRLVGRELVGQATGALNAVWTVISMAGPAVGGALAAVLGPATVLGVDGLTYLAAATVLARLPLPAPGDRPPGARLSTDVADGVRYVVRHRVIGPLTLLGVGNAITGGAVTAMVVVVAVQRLGLSADDARVGWLFAAAAAGAFVAGATIARLQRVVPLGTLSLVGLGLVTVLVPVWARTTSLVGSLLLLAGLQCAATTVILNGIVARQTLAPMELQARVNTTARVIAWGGAPLGSVLAGALAGIAGVAGGLTVAAGFALVSVVAGLLSPVRTLPRLAQLTPDVSAPDDRPRTGRG